MRKSLFLALAVFACTIASAQKVLGPIRTNGAADTYPTHYDSLGKGGFRVAADTTERNLIPYDRRSTGMVVYTVADTTWWQLKGGILNLHWKPVYLGGSGGTNMATAAQTFTGNWLHNGNGKQFFLNNLSTVDLASSGTMTFDATSGAYRFKNIPYGASATYKMIFYDSVTGQLYRSYFTGIENQYSYKQTASMNISGKGKFGDTLSAPAIYLTASTGHRFIDIYGNDGTSIIAQIRGAGGFPGNSSGGQYGQIGVVNRANTNHMVTMLGINGTLICQSFRVSNLNDANQFTEITFPYNSGGVFPSYALKFPKGNGTLVRTVNGIEGDSTGNIDLSFATGSIWINGNGAPTDGVGFNGNYYFDSVSKAAYFRRNGSWGFQGYWLQALPTTPNLQQVLNAGNTATQGATFGNTVVAPSYNLTSGSTNISLRPQTDAGSMIAYFPMRAEDQSVVYEQDMIDSLDNRAARISKTTTATTSLSTLATINCSTANTVYTIQFTATGINSAGDVGSFKMYSVVKNIGGTLTVVEQLGEQTVADPGFTSGGFSLGVSVSGTNAFIKTEPGTALQTAWTVKYDVVKATLP